MSTLLEQLRQARDSGDFSALVAAVPYARFLGVTLETRGGELVGRMRYGDHLVGNPTVPALHGGTLGALLELAAQFELLYRADSVLVPKTITLTIDYLRSAKPVDTWVRAKVVRHGRRVATVHAAAWQDDEARPVATANVTMLVKAELPATPG